jgi:carboxymethylenebutenolidase
MEQRLIEVSTPSCPMRTFLACPQKSGPFPAVVLFMDMWGMREELFDIARRIASTGYYCAVPDFYHRLGDNTLAREHKDSDGRSISVFRLSKEQLSAAIATLNQLTDSMVLDDTAALFEFFRSQPVVMNAIGVVGYCMGGRHAIEAAVRFPENIQAAASLHGSFLISDRSESPHLALERIRGELYCGFAEDDLTASTDMVASFIKLAHDAGVTLSTGCHRGTQHGYALPSRDVYNHEATERDWQMIFKIFARRLRA